VSAAKELLSNYQHVISELRLVTGSRGVFDVRVDGELVFSKHALGRHAKPGELLDILKALLPPDTEVYGAEH
jgi:selT/selW/selH-like putative selenoprotein